MKKKRTSGAIANRQRKEVKRLKKRDKMHINHKMHLYYYIARMAQFDCYYTAVEDTDECDITNNSKMNDWCPSCLAKHMMQEVASEAQKQNPTTEEKGQD